LLYADLSIEQRKTQKLKEQPVTNSEWNSLKVVTQTCNKLTAQLNEDWTELRAKSIR